MNAPSHENPFRFDQYEVDLLAAELRKNGRKIRIQDKPLRLLAYLSQRPGEVVTRSEIQQYLWAADTTVDFNDGLNTAVKKLREALNDDSERPRYIETVPRRGYRFLAKVDTLPAVGQVTSAQVECSGIEAPVKPKVTLTDSSPAVQISATSSGTRAAAVVEQVETVPNRRIQDRRVQDRRLPEPLQKPGPLRWVYWVVGAVLLVAAAGWVVRWQVRKRADAGMHPSIVVLPFANLTGDGQRGYLSDGVTEEVITRLASGNTDDLRVIARTSAMTFRNTTLTAKQIGGQLGVDYLLEGSLQGGAGKIRLIAQLVKASDQTHLWAKTYEGDISQLQEFENDIADSAARLLLEGRERSMAVDHSTIGAEAHDLYLQGLSSLSERSLPGFEAALLNFGKAVQLEPRYARAYAELAVTYNLMGQYNWMRQGEARTQGRAAAMQALAIDPSLAEAKAALGFSYWFYDWNPSAAKKELSNAVAQEPNNVDAHHWLAMVMLTSGRFDEAEQHLRAALRLDPNSMILQTNLGWIHYSAGKYSLAVREMTAVVKAHPEFLSAHLKLWYTYSAMQNKKKAWMEYQTVVRAITTQELDKKIEATYPDKGYAAALKALVSGSDNNSYANHVDRARALNFAGDGSGAIDELQRGLAEHDGWMMFVPTDPAFHSVQGDARFEAVVHEVEQVRGEIP